MKRWFLKDLFNNLKNRDQPYLCQSKTARLLTSQLLPTIRSMQTAKTNKRSLRHDYDSLIKRKNKHVYQEVINIFRTELHKQGVFRNKHNSHCLPTFILFFALRHKFNLSVRSGAELFLTLHCAKSTNLINFVLDVGLDFYSKSENLLNYCNWKFLNPKKCL